MKPIRSPEKTYAFKGVKYLWAIVWAGAALSLSACENTGGKVEGKVSGGIGERANTWNFTNSGEYIYNSNYVEVGGGARLKAVNTTFNDLASFNRGTYTGTMYTGGALKINTAVDTSLSAAWAPKWSNIIGYWKMENNWNDSSGKLNHLSSTGATLDTTVYNVGTGSALFTNTTDSLVTASALSPAATHSVSVSLWLKRNPTGENWMSLLQAYATYGWRVVQNGSTTRVCLTAHTDAVGGLDQNLCSTAAGIQPFDGGWHHVVGVLSSGSYAIYIDGTLDTSGSYNHGSGFGAAGILKVGKNPAGLTDTFVGYLDDVAIWNVPLSAADAALIYHRQKQKHSGSYDSPVIDMGAAGASWTNLSAAAPLPFGKEIHASGSESGTYGSVFTGSTLATNLVGHWKFNETAFNGFGSADYRDSSPTGNHLTDVNTSYLAQPGELGYSVRFTGTNASDNKHATGTGYNLTAAASGFAWVKGETLSSTMNIMRSGFGSEEKFGLFMNTTSGVLSYEHHDGTAYRSITSSGSTVARGRWYHVGFVRAANGTGVKLYVDGKVVANNATAGAPAVATPTTFYIGATGNSQAFSGNIDEAALWSRELDDAEVIQLYRRGANRLKYQTRSCADAACACKTLATGGSASDCSNDGTANDLAGNDANQANWIGPDGTSATYFSELQNNTSVDASGNPTGSVNVTGLNLDFSTSFFTTSARPIDNRYFQYRVFMESNENTACSSAACMPELTSIEVGPAGRYYGGQPTIQNAAGISHQGLTAFFKSDTNACSKFQLSNDGTNWKYWNGTGWAAATNASQTNFSSDFTAANLAALGAGSFFFKAFLNTNGTLSQSCELNTVGIGYK